MWALFGSGSLDAQRRLKNRRWLKEQIMWAIELSAPKASLTH